MISANGNGEARRVRLTIPAKAEYITLCRLALTGLAGLRPMSEEVLADLKLALTEACSNSIRHAYGESGGLVRILYELYPDRLAIEVVDDGLGFTAVDREPVGEELSGGGLGIAIIRAIADQFEIGESPDGQGSRLRFEKLLNK